MQMECPVWIKSNSLLFKLVFLGTFVSIRDVVVFNALKISRRVMKKLMKKEVSNVSYTCTLSGHGSYHCAC